MKVALYARVSSPGQEKQGTIASQVEALRRHARKEGLAIVEEFVQSRPASKMRWRSKKDLTSNPRNRQSPWPPVRAGPCNPDL